MKQKLLDLWNFLTAVHPSITDIEQRRNSKLLASLTIFLLAGICFNLIIRLTNKGQFGSPVGSVLLISLMLITIGLNRIGRYTLGANLFLFTTAILLSIVAATERTGYTLLSLSIVLILGVLLLSPQAIYAIAGLSLVITLGYSIMFPVVGTLPSFFPLMNFLLNTIVVFVYVRHRNQLEAERRQELLNANEALRRSEASLEQRVKERTRDLELATEVSRQITTMLDLNQLLKAIADQTKEAFQMYHVSVFLCDQSQERLWLAAGAGSIGEQMRENGKSFFWNVDKGIVPEAARTETSVLVNDVVGDAHYLKNPLLPETRSELAVPMIANGKIIGVLDLQAKALNHFNNDIVRVMSMLAEQLAIAVENATLFDEVESSRQEQVAVAEKLRAVDNMKSQFLASMSHELRTPLNAILNFTKFVQTGMLGPVNEKQKDALSKTINSGKHLLSLINDVLDITKIESDMLNLFVEEDVSLSDELETIAATAETLLADKPEVVFVREYDAALLPDIICDRRRVRQILLNLVSNACKFTEAGQVTLYVSVEASQIKLVVKDTGPGIPQEDHELIFESFRQSHAGMSKGGGTGLGLPIARRLAEAHGGSLSMESVVGQGTTFSVVLPIASSELLSLIKVGKAS